MLKTVTIIGLCVLMQFTGLAPAHADPCTAPLPDKAGIKFSGVATYIGDGDSLCIGTPKHPETWIEVRLADFNAPELSSAEGVRAKETLAAVAAGRTLTCVTQKGRKGSVIVYDRVIARCRLDGQALGKLLRAAGAPEGGR